MLLGNDDVTVPDCRIFSNFLTFYPRQSGTVGYIIRMYVTTINGSVSHQWVYEGHLEALIASRHP